MRPHSLQTILQGSRLALLAPLLALILVVSTPSSDRAEAAYSDFVSVSAGGSHTCAVTTSGGAKCWGANSYGQLGDGTTTDSSLPVDVAGLTSGVVQVSAGSFHTCALTTTGGIKCWGNNWQGRLGDGTTTERHSAVDVVGLTSGVTQVSAGGEHTCAVTTAGGVKCWGNNNWGRLGDGNYGAPVVSEVHSATPVDVVSFTSGAAQVSAGENHTCAVTIGGGAKCWGYGNFGQLGTAPAALTVCSYDPFDMISFHCSPAPLDVAGATSGVTQISAGFEYTCAITTGGGVKCWGWNDHGQLGDGNGGTGPELCQPGPAACSTTPVNVSELTSGVAQINADYSACAVTTGGGAKCWGYNVSGQLGDGTTTGSSVPVDVIGLNSGVASISGVGNHTCAVTTAGGAKCWGNNLNGQLGNWTDLTSHVPFDVGYPWIAAASAGAARSCAVSVGENIWCWGAARLGDGSLIGSVTPVYITQGTAVSTGDGHTCAIDVAGGALCWGSTAYGALGNGSAGGSTTSVGVSGLSSGVAQISAGSLHTCAVTTSGGAKCWGINSLGALGDGNGGTGPELCTAFNTPCSTTPVDVVGLTSGVAQISAGRGHTCAVTTAGGVKCWGSNAHGQLGNGTTTNSDVPIDVTGLTSGVASVSAGFYTTCAVLTSGGVKCWGNNADGQLGNGNAPTGSTTPVDVSGLSTAVDVDAGGFEFFGIFGHACALLSDGSVTCWGSGNDTPVSVSGLTAGADLDVGAGHACAVTAGSGLVCWGSNAEGQLGVGAEPAFSDVPLETIPDVKVVAKLAKPGDTDGDGCADVHENGSDETLGGQRDWQNPWDFYDVSGDQVVELFADILQVIAHFAPLGTEPEYDVAYDRGPTAGPNQWNMTAPDGKIELFVDILGVIAQFGHDCR